MAAARRRRLNAALKAAEALADDAGALAEELRKQALDGALKLPDKDAAEAVVLLMLTAHAAEVPGELAPSLLVPPAVVSAARSLLRRLGRRRAIPAALLTPKGLREALLRRLRAAALDFMGKRQ